MARPWFPWPRWSWRWGSVCHFCKGWLPCALIPDVLKRLDEPLADPPIVPTYLRGRFTRRQVRVALSGDGGDERFAGYDPFRALPWQGTITV